MNTKELLKKVRKIEIKTKRLSNHLFGGEYHSRFKGKGMTFSEVRQYQFGDDIRAIDWNVTARCREPYVKVFEEERELSMILVVDISGSEFFATRKQFKNEFITEIAATLAFSATQNNDKIGLILFTDKIELFIPPKKGKHHVLRIIRELIEFQPTHKKTDITNALKFLTDISKKRSIVFILSDFMDDNYQKTLMLASKKHDITGIRIYDKIEEQIPNLGLIQVQDEETDQIKLVDTASKRVRRQYNTHYRNKVDYFHDTFKKSGTGVLNIEVSESYVKSLLLYFKSR